MAMNGREREYEQDRAPDFTPGVRQALSRLADVATEVAIDRPEEYAQPERRSTLIGRRAAGYSVDMEQMEREIATDPKDDLRNRFCRLTYGDMVDVCAGILAATEGKPISTQDELAKVIHKWAKST